MNPFTLNALREAIAARRKRGSQLAEQQAASQAWLVNSNLLPIQLSGAQRWELQELGFEFGDEFDDLFVRARLPEGWSKVASDHVLHSHLLDERGRRRAAIFYRATHGSERADMTLLARFQVDAFTRALDGRGYEVAITDAGQVVQRFGAWSDGAIPATREAAQKGQRERDRLSAQANDWLRRRRPQWHNPMIYWNEGPAA